MSIEKKSLISALKTTKKANVATAPEGEKAVSSKAVGGKNASLKSQSFKSLKAHSFKSLKAHSFKSLKSVK